MKKKISTVNLLLIVTLLTTGICLRWNCKVLAAERGNATESVRSINEYSQFEMPIVVINTDSDSKISSDEVYSNGQISIINDQGTYEMSNLNMSIKLRGNSTKYLDKASYKMKFNEKQNLLNIGSGKAKTWSLIANYYDSSLLRNLTVYRFADLLTGMSYSPNCRSIELFLNGKYQGVYLLCEGVSINKHRVAIKEAPDEVGQNGYLIEMSRYAKGDIFSVDTATYEIKSDLSATESIKRQQINYIANYIQKSYHSLKGGKQKEAEKYLNLDSLVDIYIGNEIVKNIDAGWDSFYMYKDVNGKLTFGPMWDFDLALGNANCVKGFDSWAGFNAYHILNVNANSNPWFCHALSCKWFRELVRKRWNKLQNQINDLPNTVINEAQANYQSYCRNFEKWDVLGRQVYIEPKELAALPTFKDHYSYLSSWLANRVKWLTEAFNGKNFSNGIFVNEDDKIFSVDSNLLEISPILALANSTAAAITYELSPNLGTSIAIQNGGAEEWHVQAIASGFMVEKGAAYVLSFDYRCSEERSLAFNIQQNYEPYASYYTGDLKMTNELQHYEVTFTAPADDSNAALVFNLGRNTFNGTVVAFDKLSLVKKN